LIARETGVQRAIVVGLEQSTTDWEESLDELVSLADTAGLRSSAPSRRSATDRTRSTYLGKGRAQELHETLLQLDAELILVDGELSPSQQRHLED